MGFTQLGAMPKNQLDALPLIDAATEASGGVVSIGLGGGITRFFSSTVLGVTNAPLVLVTSEYVLPTNYLDVRGCTRFAAIIRRTDGGNFGSPVSMNFYMQYRQGPTDTPPAGYNSLNGPRFYGRSLLNTSGFTWPNPTTAAGAVETVLVTWAADETVGAAGTAGFMGTDVRLILSSETNDPNVPSNQLFTITLWGTS